MNKEYNLKLDLQFKCTNPTMEFNEYDASTSDFYIRITSGGKLVDIEEALVVLVAIKPSGQVTSQFVEITNGLVYADLKSNMKDEIGVYQAKAMLLLGEERVVTDIISYKIIDDTMLALLNETAQEDENYTLLTDMLTRLSVMETNEQQRIINEENRILEEENRILEEENRILEERARIEAEQLRVEAENNRRIVEQAREIAEDARSEEESLRQANETLRQDNEELRQDNEEARQDNEELRQANEETRVANEEARQSNETSRENVFANQVYVIDNMIDDLNEKQDELTDAVDEKIDEIETRFATLTTEQQQDAEVIDARDGEVSLATRLNRDIENAQRIFVDIEGSTIKTDSSEGYLKDVEILGNTVQNAEDLADIRSVGTKVEGQELYEIPVVSCGKNLFDISSVEEGYIQEGVENSWSGFYKTDFIKINEAFYVSRNSDMLNTTLAVVYYDINKNYISTSFMNTTDIARKFPYDGQIHSYIRITGTYSSEAQIQLEKGIVVTPYEPYVEDKLIILSPTPLEKVGDIADRIICKDGVWGVEKNIYNEVFTVDDVSTISFLDNVARYVFKSRDGLVLNIKAINNYTSKFYTDFTYDSESWYEASGTVVVKRNKATVGDTEEKAKEYLKNNPIVFLNTTTQPQFIPLPHDQQVKLRTFAGQTNIHFETEIEPTIKAQVPKSIGASINTHTEQIENLNNELNRVKKLEESTVSTVETESDFTTVEATSNGYFEDVKLEGKTLNNLMSLATLNTNTNIANIPLGRITGTITIINAKKTEKVYINLYDDSGYKGAILITSNNYCLTVPEGQSIGQLYDNVEPQMPISDLVKDVIILEGDHTQNPPSYFEGLLSAGQDVEEVSVESVNENLFDGELIPNNIDIITTGSNNICTKNFIPIKSGQQYTITNELGYHLELFFYDSEFRGIHFLSLGMSYDPLNPSFIAPSGYKYVRFRTWSGENDTNVKICISRTNGVNSYVEPNQDKKPLLYYNPTTSTWEKPVLREWDSIEKHSDGKYYYHKRSGEVVLNGSEDWVNHTVSDNYISFIPGSRVWSRNQIVICDKFKAVTWYGGIVGEFIWSFTETCGISIAKSKLSTQDVAGFKAWLQTNPTTVVYQLAQEEVYECTNIDLITYENETNYIVSSGAISPISTLKVHNNISNVVSILQEKVSLLETKFVEMFKFVLSGDYQSLAFNLYPEDFATTDATNETEELDDAEE